MKILHILAGLKTGGAESFLINLREALPDDIRFDFLLRQKDNDPRKIEYFRGKGSRIFITSDWPRSFIKNYYETKKILLHSDYDFLHIHCNSLMYMSPIKIALKRYPASKIVIHSHSTRARKKYLNILHFINKEWLSNICVTNLACSDNAGKWMFKKNYEIIPNSINVDNYCMNEQELKQRSDNEIVLVSVGRVSEEKNYGFMIDIVKRLLDVGYNIKYYIAGDGSQVKKLRTILKKKSLENNIFFLGNVHNVPKLLKKAHIFVMPSLYEGFGISLLEAETIGIPAVVSNAVPDEAVLCKNVYKLQLNYDDWVEKIRSLLLLPHYGYLKENHNVVKNSNYGLRGLRKIMMKVYAID